MEESWWPADTFQVFHVAPGKINYFPTPALRHIVPQFRGWEKGVLGLSWHKEDKKNVSLPH